VSRKFLVRADECDDMVDPVKIVLSFSFTTVQNLVDVWVYTVSTKSKPKALLL